MSSYCTKCKTDTPSEASELHTTKNGKHYIKSSCSKCGTTKCRFISAADAAGGGVRRVAKKKRSSSY